jgi:hypothetical protein
VGNGSHLSLMGGISVLGSLASIVGLLMYIGDRYTGLPEIPPLSRTSIVLQLGILCAIAWGILWSAADQLIYGGKYGGGGGSQIAHGWSAVIISVTLTTSIATVPFLYQRFTGQRVLLSNHWQAFPYLIALGALAYILIFGTGPTSFTGLSRWIAPLPSQTTLGSGIAREFAFAGVCFPLIIFPYRIIVRPPSTSLIMEAFLGRTVLPGLVYVLGMTAYIIVRYPGSLQENTWIEVRGVLSGLIQVCCYCAGMFL